MKCSRCLGVMEEKNQYVALYEKYFYICFDCGEMLEDMLEQAQQTAIGMFAEPMLNREKKIIH